MHTVTHGTEIGDLAVFVHADTEAFGCRGQTPGEARGIDQDHVGVVDRPVSHRARDVAGELVAIEESQRLVEALTLTRNVFQVVHLPLEIGDVELTVALCVGVDAQAPHRSFDLIECLHTHPEQLGQLIGVAVQSVHQAMGQTGRTEPAVASRRSFGDPRALEQDDRPRRICLGRLHRCPQSGEPTADDRQVRSRRSAQPSPCNGAIGPVEPEGRRRRLGDHGRSAGGGRQRPGGGCLYCGRVKTVRCHGFCDTPVMSLITCLMVRYSSSE